MKAIQEKYKDDKQRLNMELANLYKSEGVNPLAGCLPLVVQMPIMIGIFYVSVISIMPALPTSCGWKAFLIRIRLTFYRFCLL